MKTPKTHKRKKMRSEKNNCITDRSQMDVRACVWSYICMHGFFHAFNIDAVFLYFSVCLYKNEHLNTNFVSRLYSALVISPLHVGLPFFLPSLCANIYSPKSAFDSFNMALDLAFLFRLLHTRSNVFTISWKEWEFGAAGKKGEHK